MLDYASRAGARECQRQLTLIRQAALNNTSIKEGGSTVLLHWKTALAVTLCAVACSQRGLAQPPATILTIDLENFVQYNEDIDFSKFATNPNVTTSAAPASFGAAVGIADIVAVNGQPAKGTVLMNARSVALTPAPTSGQAIADAQRGGAITQTFEILDINGQPVGTIVAAGVSGGTAPPGAPTVVTQANNAIVGGTGAFLGARGYVGQSVATVALRRASMSEDPAKRRINGGGKTRYVVQLIPLSYPEIAFTSSGPAVTHSSDFTLVTSAKPAVPGEILSLFAHGLGPTRPGVDPGRPFPSTPPSVVSPVDVKVNGVSAEVLAAVGLPGAVDGYQVNFRVPSDAVSGVATVQVSAAWIAGPSVNLSIR